MRQAMENKTPEMKSMINNMSNNLFAMTVEEAVGKGVCVKCKKPAMSYCYSDAGVNEYYISGLCERCWDQIVGGGDE